jgi:hypothetical protein
VIGSQFLVYHWAVASVGIGESGVGDGSAARRLKPFSW